MAALKVCLLSPGLPGTDPADAVGQHARRLAGQEGVEVALALTEHRPAGDSAARFGDARVVAVETATQESFDIALATSWETTAHVFSVPATRPAYYVDHFAHRRMADWQADRFAAQLSYDLPLDFVAAGQWVVDALAQLRPGARCVVARAGVDKTVFAAGGSEGPTVGSDGGAGPLRILVDDRWLADGDESTARAALAQATAPHTAAWLEAGDDARTRAAKYRAADVLLMLSPVDGVLGSPLEAMHCGTVPVVLPAGGQEELVRHVENGVVAEPDDLRGTARWLDQLAADHELPSRLRGAALATAEAWPSLDEATAELRAALEQLVAEPPPEDARWPERLMADAMAATAVLHNDHHVAAAYIRRLEVEAARAARPFAHLRRAAGPLVRRARRRLAP